jgi:hypothetical protein
MQIVFRRFDNTVSPYKPVEKAVLFDGQNEDLAIKQFNAMKALLHEQCEQHLVDIFHEDDDVVKFTRTFISSKGVMPNEDCYLNLLWFDSKEIEEEEEGL